jgi:hypothetical protein
MLVQKLNFLPHCWVCETRFSPSCKEERHHVVPVAYGGVDGPQVSLCDSHHSALHEIALKLYSRRPYHQLLSHDPKSNQKLLYLASVAYNARIATENDPNKKRVEVIPINGDTLHRIKSLQTIYKLSREKLFKLAIDQMYSRHYK